MKRIVPFLFLWIAFLAGCQDDGTRYHRYSAVPAEGWKPTDTLSFRLPARFTYHKYALEIGIRHGTVYPYQDLWLAVIHPLTPALRPDTIHIQLADGQGNWLGKGTSGSQFQRAVPAGEIICFPADSLLQIVHLMKDSVLSGISDVGIRLALPARIDAEKDK